MKKIFLSLFVIAVVMVACKKESSECPYTESTAVAPTAEIDSLSRYLAANNINATRHPSGVYYVLDSAGTGASPTVCSYITTQYKGTLLTGAQFDGTSGNNVAGFSLGNLIVGWQRVLPLLKVGGGITLYIPPTLGYGPQEKRDANNNVIIPANSYLKFKINLLQVQ